MALKVELKPGERIIIGESVITNDHQRTRLFIEGNAPILREKDVLTPETADTPAKRVYLAVQLMYLSSDPSKIHKDFFQLVNDIITAAPSTIPYVNEISNNILSNSLYKALKEAKKLIEYERKLIGHVQSGNPDVSEHGTHDSQPAGTGSQPAAEGGSQDPGGEG
ncbi:MAG: flagellar biosynthesis repressor FlbT [Hyphomicrobiales bacterium]|nr:MAG: flagellar biosynthesis repressor FlbT [Hyphomicrobiales bacterium]